MKLQFIYIFYINDNRCDNEIYNMHYMLLERYSHIFDSIHIIFVCDVMNTDIMKNIKVRLLDTLHCNHIIFSVEKNDPQFREGIYYKKYVIDRLEELSDRLVFFGHTKGVTNQFGIDNIDNLKYWIYALYYLNLEWIDEVKRKLLDYNTDYVTYGALYFKDYRHNNIHNWFYSGSFYWLNTKRLLDIIHKDDIDIYEYCKDANERLKRCAELFPGYILDHRYVGFHNDEMYDKSIEVYHFYGWNISYLYIDDMIKTYMNVFDYDKLKNDYINMLNAHEGK